MKIISLFNNKGGVGKSTLCYHLGCALGEMGKRVLFVDLDPQCNLTISAMDEEELHKIWKEEDDFIDDYEAASKKEGIEKIFEKPRSIHFLLKPAEDGLDEISNLPPTVKVNDMVSLIPGRLSLHKYENKISERWSGLYQSDNLSIRTIINIRRICEKYSSVYNYDYVLIDTSPSLGILNKVIISTVDGFLIPASPDMFSMYGIRNIGNSLEQWQSEFNIIYQLISKEKREKFPQKFVQFLGYTIYNAKKQSKNLNPYDLAQAHYAYVKEMPAIIEKYIKLDNRVHCENIMEPIGGMSVMYSHNTFPSVAQALKCPMWLVPETYAEYEKMNKRLIVDKPNPGHYKKYKETLETYITFAKDLVQRMEAL